jgi:hypothetical protein
VNGSEQCTVWILAVENDPGVVELLRDALQDVDGWAATAVHDASPRFGLSNYAPDGRVRSVAALLAPTRTFGRVF